MINRSELDVNTGRNFESDDSPELDKSSLVIATDIEGPHLIGDTALNVMSHYVHPDVDGHDVDYGAILYGETYNWFEENFDTKGLGQEGSDILLAMPALLYVGVNSEMLREQAQYSKRTPGSEKYIKYLKRQGAIIVGVTTAWQDAHREIVVNKIGLDDIVGTDFPIDEARSRLQASGNWGREMVLTGNFLRDSFSIIKKISMSLDGEKEKFASQLRDRIGQFYCDELGISWDKAGKQTVINNGHVTELSKIMSECDVIGDRRKAEVAKQLFSSRGKLGAINIAIGDGFNDRRMLAQSAWSIGINGAEAAKAAKIGIIAAGVGAPLIVITEMIQRNPLCSEANIQDVVRKAQDAVEDKAIIHRGGTGISPELVAGHNAMKKEIRGKGALLP